MKIKEYKILKYALAITGVLIAYFHLMQLLGLAHIIELRALNGVFLASGLFLYLKEMKQSQKSNFEYLPNFFNSLAVGVVTSLMFTIYISAYICMIDVSFYQEILSQEALGEHVTKLSIPIVIFIESAASAYLFTYISMQYLKKEVGISGT